MGESIKEIELNIVGALPGLANDPKFKVTSPETTNYNCIAWAFNYNKCWMQPFKSGNPELDAVLYWPKGVSKGNSPECLVEAFRTKGYELCESAEHEEGYRKVALYAKDGEWTHASRELIDERVRGFWTSKLGPMQDIQHSNPYTIEGEAYGKVFAIMKKPF